MSNGARNSIARKLAMQICLVLAAAFLFLLAGAFFSLRHEIRRKGEYYTGGIVGMYADLSVYLASNANRPIDISYNDRLNFFGDYICAWYHLNYSFVYVPDIENGKITYLSVSRNKEKFGELAEDHMVGVTEDHVLTENEMKAWRDSSVFALEKSNRFGTRNSTDIMMSCIDSFGNKVMFGASYSLKELSRDSLNGIPFIILFLIVIAALVAGLLYLLLRRMVSTPAEQISRQMSEYISEGKRSTIRLDTNGDDEFSMISESFNHMTEEIDKYIKDIDRLGREQERQQAEVDIAAEIQNGILPFNYAFLSNCAIKAVMKPAKLIGGDLYDYLEIDGSHTMTVVADVSGKGIPSAMLMAMALTLIRQFARLGYSPADILRSVNDVFADENPKLMFVTAFVGIYDSENGTFTYANAGHNPPYLIHDEPVALEESVGTPLGLFSGEEYENAVVSVQEGDSVFLYTDGVNEAVNEAGEFFGTERLEEVLCLTAKSEGRHCVEAVEAALHDFTGNAEQNDDITMLSCLIRKRKKLELNYDIGDFSAIREHLFGSSIPKEMLMDLCVAAEECFVNICSYAFDEPAPEGEKIIFELEYSNKVIMRFSDGGRQFDPRNNLPDTEEYDIDTAVGGLGRLIAFTVADSVDYEYRDGRNILTITKSIK